MNNRKYLVIGLLIILVFSIGCVGENTSPKSGINEEKTPVKSPITTTTINPVKTTIVPTQTPEPTEYLVVRYSAQTVEKFRDKIWTTEERYIYPKQGNVFLVLTVNITNIGYPSIKTDWTDWQLSVSTQDNPNTYVDTDLSINALHNVDIDYKGASIENGGYYKAQVPYEAPKNWANYKLKYGPSYKGYNIKWEPEN